MGPLRKLILLFFVLVASFNAAHAEEPFYKNKRLTLLINFAIGAG